MPQQKARYQRIRGVNKYTSHLPFEKQEAVYMSQLRVGQRHTDDSLQQHRIHYLKSRVVGAKTFTVGHSQWLDAVLREMGYDYTQRYMCMEHEAVEPEYNDYTAKQT